VRFGVEWGLVWQDADSAPRERWHGQLVKEMHAPSSREANRYLGAGASIHDLEHIVVWAGAEIVGRTRRAVVDALRAEALV
jgi:hypothetical protein